MFDRFQEFGVFLPHDLVELGGSHSGVLQLLEGFSRVYGLMLTGVADKQNAILGTEPVQEFLHLLSAGQTRLIDQEKAAVCRVVGVGLGLLAGSHRQIGLQGVGGDAGSLAELVSRARSGGEACDGVPVVLGSFADGFEGGRFASARESLQAMDLIT